ncbi:MAG: phosphopyruvate hydratase [Candidatus Babeliales bacterium]
MKIAKIQAREIFDSRGYPTIACYLYLDDGFFVASAVPAGKSKGPYEAHELRDGGDRFNGQGISKAIQIIEEIIAPALVGKEPDVVVIDQILLQLDGTDDKSKLGANSMLAASMAVIKAQAVVNEMELYEFIAQLLGYESVMLPIPFFNVINGGMHADNKLHIQEFMIVPSGAQNFRQSLEYGVEFYHRLKDILKRKKLLTCVGDEGGFAPLLTDDRQALDLLMETIQSLKAESLFKIALDAAASFFYNKQKKAYEWYGKLISTQELIELYGQWVQDYPIFSLEDGLVAFDIEGWQTLTATLGKKIQILGDDIFATNPTRIYQGIIEGLATGSIIKPNQIGTITETLQALQLCQEHGFNTLVSHRSGETNDAFIADLAVGANAGQIKAGGLSRGERLAKYNRLLMIEDELALAMLEN